MAPVLFVLVVAPAKTGSNVLVLGSDGSAVERVSSYCSTVSTDRKWFARFRCCFRFLAIRFRVLVTVQLLCHPAFETIKCLSWAVCFPGWPCRHHRTNTLHCSGTQNTPHSTIAYTFVQSTSLAMAQNPMEVQEKTIKKRLHLLRQTISQESLLALFLLALQQLDFRYMRSGTGTCPSAGHAHMQPFFKRPHDRQPISMCSGLPNGCCEAGTLTKTSRMFSAQPLCQCTNPLLFKQTSVCFCSDFGFSHCTAS